MATAPFFSATIDGHRYELKKLTLGDARLLKRRFGLDDLEDLNPTDPDQLVGFLYLALTKEDPTLAHDVALERAENVDFADLMEAEAEPEPEERSAPLDEADAPGVPEKAPGSRATTRKSSGTPS